MTDSITLPLPLSRRLKQETEATHQALDAAIMAGKPFSSRDAYARFLKVQFQFHRDIHPIYEDARVAALLPDLQSRCRLADIAADLKDLGQEAPGGETQVPADDLATRLGWLYVAEGSNLGAAFLLKAAASLDLGEELGARHLAAHPEGRGLQWKRFQHAMDEAELDEAARQRVIAGAHAAFKRVHALTDEAFGA